jgi:L-2-hydroxyglutarate oxidase LhgO
VYPVPEPGGLGVRVTLDLGRQARFGPDVEWVDTIDYTVDPCRADRFYAAMRRYWPGLPDGRSSPGTPASARRSQGRTNAPRTSSYRAPRAHGVPGLVNLFGIESPGLTAPLPLAGAVLDELR